MKFSLKRAAQRGLSNLGIVVIVVLILLLFGGLPLTGWHNYGWGPSGFFGLLLVIVLVLILLDKI